MVTNLLDEPFLLLLGWSGPICSWSMRPSAYGRGPCGVLNFQTARRSAPAAASRQSRRPRCSHGLVLCGMFQLVQHRARSRAPRKVEGGLDALQPNGNLGLSVRQEVEDRLSTLRDRMAAIRQGDKAALQRSYRNGSELHGSVLWCDSDPEVASCADVLRGSGLALRTFTEPEALLEAYDAFPQDVLCIMSSMMEGNGRKERGAMNAFGLFSAIRSRVKATEGLEQPLLAVISCSADENAARAAGAEIVVFGSRAKAQNLVVTRLRKSLGLQAGYVGK